MGMQTSLRLVALDIKKEASKRGVESDEDIQQIAIEIMEQYKLNIVERRIVRSFLDEMVNQKPKPSEK